MHAGFDRARGILDGGLQLAQFLEFHFARDVGFDVVDVTLHAAEQMAERARDLRQPLRANHDQGDDRDHDHLGKADIKHAGCGAR